MKESLTDKVSMYAAMLVSGILSFYFMLTESGPFLFLAELQADYLFDGSYYPKYTFVAIFLAISGICMLLFKPLFKKVLKDL